MPSRTSVSFGSSRTDKWLGHAASMPQRCVACVACVAAAGALAFASWNWMTRHDAFLDRQARLQSELSRLRVVVPRTKAASRTLGSQQVARYNEAVGQLNTPWSNVFDALERQGQAEVSLTMLEPDAKVGTLHVQAEARDIDTLLAYADRLAADASFGSLSLQQHETNAQDANHPVRLSFDVRLAGADVGAKAER